MNSQQPLGSIQVHVRNPETVLFDGPVDAVSSINEGGPFDVLPMHENFISLIKEKITLVLPTGSTKEILCDVAVMQVNENMIIIHLGIGQGMEKEHPTAKLCT